MKMVKLKHFVYAAMFLLPAFIIATSGPTGLPAANLLVLLLGAEVLCLFVLVLDHEGTMLKQIIHDLKADIAAHQKTTEAERMDSQQRDRYLSDHVEKIEEHLTNTTKDAEPFGAKRFIPSSHLRPPTL